MRRVAGVSPLTLPLRRRKRRRGAQTSVHPSTLVTALTLAAVLVAAALFIGEHAARYLPGPVAISSWQPPRVAHDTSAPPPSQSSNARRRRRARRSATTRGLRPILRGSALRAEHLRVRSRLSRRERVERRRARTHCRRPGAPRGTISTAKTASGEDMDGERLTAAHPTLPLGTRVRVANLDNGRSVVVRINDRGPFAKDRIIDLSKAAAVELGMIDAGVANVRVSPVDGAVASTANARRALERFAPSPDKKRARQPAGPKWFDEARAYQLCELYQASTSFLT